MLHRQKLKQAQDAESKSTSAANAKTESASDIQARFTRSKAEALSTAQTAHGVNKGSDNSAGQANADNEIKSGDLNPVGHEDSRELQDHSPEPLNSAQSLEKHLERIIAAQNIKIIVLRAVTLLNWKVQIQARSLGNTHAHSSDTMHTSESKRVILAQTTRAISRLMNLKRICLFQMTNLRRNQTLKHRLRICHLGLLITIINHLNTLKVLTMLKLPQIAAPITAIPEQMESAGDRSFARDALNFDTPLSSTYDGQLKAYLNDGSKLTHASQIDEWSNLVEQMPVAGLLKQLVLHASFSRAGNQCPLKLTIVRRIY